MTLPEGALRRMEVAALMPASIRTTEIDGDRSVVDSMKSCVRLRDGTSGP